MNYQPLAIPATETHAVACGGKAILWDDLSRALLMGLLVLAVLTFLDYGISTDKEVRRIYGKRLLSFYLSASRTIPLSISRTFIYTAGFSTSSPPYCCRSLRSRNTRRGICSAPWSAYLASPARGATPACWQGRAPASWRRPCWRCPGSIIGAMFNNTKDVPFAAGMVWTLYFATRILDQSPNPRLSAVLKFGVVLGLTLAIRVGAVLGAFYLAVGVLLFVVLVMRRDGIKPALMDARQILIALLPAMPVAYGLMAIFWPWAVLESLEPAGGVARRLTLPHQHPNAVHGPDGPVQQSARPLRAGLSGSQTTGAGVDRRGVGGGAGYRMAGAGRAAGLRRVRRRALRSAGAGRLPAHRLVDADAPVDLQRHSPLPLRGTTARRPGRVRRRARLGAGRNSVAPAWQIVRRAADSPWSDLCIWRGLGSMHPNQYVYCNRSTGGVGQCVRCASSLDY